MSEQILTILVCGPLLVTLFIFAAVYGMRSRIKYAKRLFNVYKAKQHQTWLNHDSKRLRTLLLFEILSLALIILISSLAILDLLELTALIISVYLFLVLLGITLSIMLISEVEKRVK